MYFYIPSGRDRWVYYIKKDYDASQIAPEWYVLQIVEISWFLENTIVCVCVSMCLCRPPRAFMNLSCTRGKTIKVNAVLCIAFECITIYCYIVIFDWILVKRLVWEYRFLC